MTIRSSLITYKVICHGLRADDSNPDDVIEHFANIFRLTPDQARSYLDKTKLVIKKNISLDQAYKYKNKLEKIGINVELMAEAANYNDHQQNLSLEPINTPSQSEPQIESTQQPIGETGFTCHHCGVTQEQGKFCTACGSQLDNVAYSTNEQDGDDTDEGYYEPDNQRSEFTSIVICLVVAILGIFIDGFISTVILTQEGALFASVRGAITGILMLLVVQKTGPHQISLTILIIVTLSFHKFSEWYLVELMK